MILSYKIHKIIENYIKYIILNPIIPPKHNLKTLNERKSMDFPW